MNWEQFYLSTFIIGVSVSLVMFLAGSIRMSHFHIHAHHPGFGRLLNPAIVMVFLAWFGGTGFIIERYSSLWTYLALFLATLGGLAGAGAIFWSVAKLTVNDKALDPADYDMIGVLGKIASPIRAGGTGEMIYSRHGARRAIAARSEDGTGIPRDTEVVVTRFEKGIAYVRLWDEMRGD